MDGRVPLCARRLQTAVGDPALQVTAEPFLIAMSAHPCATAARIGTRFGRIGDLAARFAESERGGSQRWDTVLPQQESFRASARHSPG